MNILFIIFNRPEKTRRVFESIKRAKPSMLFVAADGPRADRPGEKALCGEAREIIRQVDWPCKVVTRLQDNNLGCKAHVSSSITWFFKQVESGIILEDDCLPNPSFYIFCEELLERYRGNEEIMAISGTNFLLPSDISDPTYSYRFSRCAQVWGWATWRRAWDKYDIDMKDIGSLSFPAYYDLFKERKYIKYLIKHFEHIKQKDVDTWDAQWQYSILFNHGIVASSNINLVNNIGFGTDATHTVTSAKSEMEVADMPNISHPPSIEIDIKADSIYIEKTYKRGLIERIVARAKNIMKKR